MAEIINEEKYPFNIFKPSEIEFNGGNANLFLARFNSLYDLYNYLKSNPKVNEKVFKDLRSRTNGFSFAGKPYNEALEDLVKPIDPGYNEFLDLQANFNNATLGQTSKYKTIRTVAGGRIHTPSYCAGSPYCYTIEERVLRPKFIKVFINLVYPADNTKESILNRAIIITNVVNALEKAGYSIDLETFAITAENQFFNDLTEISEIVIQIKKHAEKLNMANLYKVLCNVEFLRRVLFSVLETMSFENPLWGSSYGRNLQKSKVSGILKLSSDDIYFGYPSEMNILGKDLVSDFESAIRMLDVDDKIDVDKTCEDFETQYKMIKR